MPISSRRGPSGGWNRLKPIIRDELTIYGFPSKGETRLNDYKAQENFFNVIFERYMRFCNHSRNDLANEFAKLAIGGSSAPATTPSRSSQGTTATVKPPSLPPPTAQAEGTESIASSIPSGSSNSSSSTSDPPSAELQLILTAMRKLRESIVSAGRTDDFARTTYLFIIRATLLTHSWEAYVPALAHLLTAIAPHSPLSAPDSRAVSAWRVLDAACRSGDVAGALRLRTALAVRDANVDGVLRALVHGEWGAWWAAKRRVDGYVRAIMDMGEARVRTQALKCLARAYLSVEREYVEKVAGRSWEELSKKDGIGWELVPAVEGNTSAKDMIIIRRVKVK